MTEKSTNFSDGPASKKVTPGKKEPVTFLFRQEYSKSETLFESSSFTGCLVARWIRNIILVEESVWQSWTPEPFPTRTFGSGW
jgi:hypothetical protein